MSEPADEPPYHPLRRLRIEITFRTLLIVVLVVFSVWTLVHLVPALLVLVVALMLVGALDPLVAGLEARGVRRGLAIAIVFVAAGLATLAVLMMTVPALTAQLKDLAVNAPQFHARAVETLSRSSLTAPFAEAVKNVSVDDLLKASKDSLFQLTGRVFEIIAYSVSVIFLAIYVMIDRDRLRGALFAVIPKPHHLRLSRVLLDLESIVGGYIRGQVITCVFMAVYILILLSAFRVPHALAIAVFGAVADLLPYFGIVLTMVPAVLAATVKGGAVTVAVFLLLFAYEEFEGRILIPLVYGRALRMPSSLVFFSLLAGMVLAGVAGALLALPIAAAALMLVKELRVQLPGTTPQPEDRAAARSDEQSEKQYRQLTKDSPAEEAAAVAMDLSEKRKQQEKASEVGDAEK